MSNINLRNITNNFQDVRLGSLASSLFFQRPEPDRADFVFRTAEEVMQLMNGLPPKVQIIR